MTASTGDEITLIIGVAFLMLLTLVLWLICMGFNKKNKLLLQEKKEMVMRFAQLESDRNEVMMAIRKLERGEPVELKLDNWGEGR